jgi:hypothetical protein
MVCAFVTPAAVNPILVDVRSTGLGDGDAAGDGLGVGVATGEMSTEPAQPANASADKRLAIATFCRLAN